MTDSNPRGRHQGGTGQDQASEQAQKAEATLSAWERLRSQYDPDVAELVDDVVARGGLTLRDIEAMELAEHERLDSEIKALSTKDKATTAISSLLSLRLQSRKHLRTLRVLISPVLTPHQGRAAVPAAVAKRHQRVLRDQGDDLVDDGPKAAQLEA